MQMIIRGLVIISLFWGFVKVSGDKVCTNTGSPAQSHTSRYELFLQREKENHDHLHLIPSDDDAWSDLIPRKMKGSLLSGGARGRVGGFLQDVSLHDVRLDPSSIHGAAQRTNLEYLLMLDVDSLAWSFRKTARLDTLGEPYGGWEAPGVELRGHFVGHYLSASAQMWASTHNADLEKKMSSLVSILSDCQSKIGTGYLSAFPPELFDRFEALEEVWAPYYTIHKILAGLLDQYTLGGNDRALKMTTWMVDYFYKRVQNVISKHTVERHWQSLNEETGGMNDVLYKLYIVTGDQKHLLLAQLFDKPCFLGLLAVKADDLSNFHSNTHIPIVIGSQVRYEITGEPLYKEIGTFFMDIVNSSHSYATGGTSVGEFWSDPKRLATTLETENEESCTTYNMLKVSRHLFRWTKEMAYADYYERALTNGVLGIQRGNEPGVMIYMLPLRAGGSKAGSYHGWGTKFDSFWCCYGTGIESFSKLGDSIYFQEEDNHHDHLALYVIQYIASTLNWKSGQLVLTQTVEPVVSWDQRLRVTITISPQHSEGPSSSILKLRVPLWTYSNGSKASLNGEELALPAPGSFLSITKSWRPRDEISLNLPLILRSEAIKDDRAKYASLQAFLYGPYLLAGLSSGDWDMIKIEPNKPLSHYFTPIPSHYNSQLITLTQELDNSTFALAIPDDNLDLKMTKKPQTGTDAALNATFRLVFALNSSSKKPGKLVKLELFGFPDMFLSHDIGGEREIRGVSDFSSYRRRKSSFLFRLISGLDGENGTVSLESDSEKGCFLYSGLTSRSGSRVKFNCSYDSSDAGFRQATSFSLEDGISKYDPISFLAKGVKRNFLLVPLLSLIDESYTVYFNTSVVVV